MPCLEVGKLSAVSLPLDAGASIEELAHVLGDDPRTLYRRDRRRVRPVADVATRMEALLAGIAPRSFAHVARTPGDFRPSASAPWR